MRERRDHAALSLEERFILAVAKPAPPAADVDRAHELSRDAGFDWSRAIRAARRCDVDTILAATLEPLADRLEVPAAARHTLAMARMASALRTERYASELGPALGALADEGIPVLLLKGAALAETVYAPGARRLVDVDLLVRREHYPRTAALLVERGFTPHGFRGASEATILRSWHEMGFYRTVGGDALGLDVHFRLYPPRSPCTIPTEDLFARARPITFGGFPALATSPEDTFVHLATQLGADGLRTSFRRAVDLYALVHAGLSAPRVAAIARTAHAEGLAVYALALAELLGAPSAPTLAARLSLASPGSPVASEVLADARVVTPTWTVRYAARVALMPLLLARLRHRLAYLFTLPLPRYGSAARLHLLLPGDPGGSGRSPLVAYAMRLRVVCLVCAALALLLATKACSALGAHNAAAHLRSRFWGRAPT